MLECLKLSGGHSGKTEKAIIRGTDPYLFFDALIGTDVEILCEGASRHNAERLTGRTRTNKIVVFEGAPRHIGQIFSVKITRASGSTLYGDPAILE